MRKKWLGVLVVVGILVGGGVFSQNAGVQAAGVAESQGVRVQLDGQLVEFPDAKPFVDSNYRTLVPVRFVAEQLQATVDWNEDQQLVTIKKSDKEITLRIGEQAARVNGESVTFDTKAIVKEDRTFVPLRFISKSFGAHVDWKEDQQLVVINTTPNGDQGTAPDTGSGSTPITGGVPSSGIPGVVVEDGLKEGKVVEMHWENGGCLFCDPNKITK